MIRSAALVLIGVTLAWAPARAQSEPEKRLAKHLEDVLRLASERHVDGPKREQLLRGAIEGALQTLDPYSRYLDKQELTRLRQRLQGSYSGIGVELAVRGGQLRVVAPLDGGPALEAGILAGDLILEIGSKTTEGMTTRDSAALLLGRPDTKVSVTVETPGVDGSKRTLELVRRKIVIVPVTFRWLDDSEPKNSRIGLIRLSTFHEETTRRLTQALDAMARPGGLVLDLRDNPGGLLRESVRVCAAFVAKGDVVSTVGHSGRVLGTHRAEENAPEVPDWARDTELPLVVLVNKGTASAAEIVAGCLQDHRRAVLVGETTFGKGSVQTILRIDADASLKLTTSRYRLPGGRLIDHKGLVPDLRADPKNAIELARDVIRSWKRLRKQEPPAGS